MTTNNNQLNIINKHDKDIDLKIWIKTLLYSYKVFPNLINTVDKIINLQASSMSFTSSIYNNSNSTKSQIERIIDLSERKKSLINIHLMIDKIFKDLSYNNRELAEKKFIDKLTNEEIAQEYDISTRTVYRKLNKIIDEIYTYFLKMNWNLKFIELQVQEEEWLIEKFKQNKKDFYNTVNKTNSIYNKSSSESYDGNEG